ncbi:MAG TPA: FAD-dependent oxidoreductase [Candidatus Saccharimonadales bacterium]|nr:FAD-dependent oxidoreductase [Candidatus Saccharimonadales bacterium]
MLSSKEMKLKFLGKSHQTGDVWTFSFAVPVGKTWLAGQSIRLELPVGYDIEEKRFTISSAPAEDRLDITTSLSGSKFKNHLDRIRSGQMIEAQSIEGDFTWSDDSRPKVLVASGIGITPFRAIIKQLEFAGEDLNFSLIYADRRNQLVFEDWLSGLAKHHSAFKLSLIRGRRLQIGDIVLQPNSLVYLSGPSTMVHQLSRQLIDNGVAEQDIKRDSFTGSPGWIG